MIRKQAKYSAWPGSLPPNPCFVLPDMKIIVVLILLTILASLASAVVFLVKDGSRTRRTVNALTVRISLSVVLFLFLMFGYYMGWFVPNQHPL